MSILSFWRANIHCIGSSCFVTRCYHCQDAHDLTALQIFKDSLLPYKDARDNIANNHQVHGLAKLK
jgi:hypothetical protein